MTLCCFCWHAFQEKGPDLGVPEWDRPLPRMAESLSLFIGLGVGLSLLPTRLKHCVWQTPIDLY